MSLRHNSHQKRQRSAENTSKILEQSLAGTTRAYFYYKKCGFGEIFKKLTKQYIDATQHRVKFVRSKRLL